MPKIAIFFFAAICAGVAVSACNSGTSVTPTPAPSISPTPDPKISSEVILVTVVGSPTANLPVAESTPNPHFSARPGTTIVTQKTNKKGETKFTGLKPSATYCWEATLKPGGSPSFTCATWPVWQSTNPIQLGT